jgi:hypothetical protein
MPYISYLYTYMYSIDPTHQFHKRMYKKQNWDWMYKTKLELKKVAAKDEEEWLCWENGQGGLGLKQEILSGESNARHV